MAKLSLFRNNELLQSLQLNDGREYFVGRAENSDIVLPAGKGISRRHFRIFQYDGVWHIEVLSKFGELYINGSKNLNFALSQDTEFEVPPYLFKFKAENQLPAVTSHLSGATDSYNQEMPILSRLYEDDRTVVGVISSYAQLKLSDENNMITQIYRLEGDAWLAGRETSCSIFLDNPKISRRQFEIYRQESAYFIRDAGSSNGTMLNGQPLSNEDWSPLSSGDIIQILNWNMQFELVDSQFEQRVAEAQPMMNMPVVMDAPAPMDTYTEDLNQQNIYQQQPIYEQTPIPPPKFEWNKKNIFRVSAGALVFVAAMAFFLFDDQGAKTEGPKKPISKEKMAFDKLSPAKQDAVRETYRLAEEYYFRGQYEMARQQILKLKSDVPAYDKSEDLLMRSEQSLQMQAEKAKIEKEEQERAEMEQKIQRQIVVCREKISPTVRMQDIEDCLSPVLQLNPEHPGIQALKAEVDQYLADRAAKDLQRSEYIAKVQRQKILFEKAKAIHKTGKQLLAIKAYRDVVDSKLPDPQSFRASAKREIASIEASIVAEQAVLETTANQAHQKGDLKGAVIALKRSLELNPESEVTKAKVTAMLFELRKQMQTYYQEGILEESVGEVETAKNKWKKIMDLSLPEEDYYKKAVIKLKKYGAL